MRRKDMWSWAVWISVVPMFFACGGSTSAAADEADSVADGTSSGVANSSSSMVLAASDTTDYSWDTSSVNRILLKNTSIVVEGTGATVSGTVATITAAGTYEISGTLDDGQIVVNTTDTGVVRMILNGVDITNSTSAPIFVSDADRAMIVLAASTENTITDGLAYTFATADSEPNAAIFSKADLTIFGEGTLVVDANYNDGIASKDGLVIASGTVSINAVDDGIRGKDYLLVEDGVLTVVAGGDGLKSTHDSDATLGYVAITGGSVTVTSGMDAIQAEMSAIVSGGTLVLTSGGGSGKTLSSSDTNSHKGIKGVANVSITGGVITINSADDAIHSNAIVTIDDGTIAITSGDDGMHADSILTINGGTIGITKSYEGIESAVVTVNGGTIHVVSSDDGVNVAGGNDGSSTGGRPGQGSFSSSGNNYLYINGGYLVVNAAGDGLDANGGIAMTAGVVLVNGPTESANGPLDYDSGFNMTGGFFVATGSSGMAQAPGGTSSAQYSMLATFSSQAANTLVHIQNSAGDDILTFAPSKTFQSLAFSSPTLVKGTTYQLYLGGSSTGTATDGLYSGGVYSAGTWNASFTISSLVTSVGSSSGMGGF